MNKTLICVDVQRDFLPGGALGVPDGHEVIPVLIDMMDDVDVIVLTRDWHPSNHVSFSDAPEFVDKSWPAHCVQGTEGAEIDWKLFSAALDTGKPVLLVHKGDERDTEEYSGFGGHVADAWNLPDGVSYDDFVDEYQNPVSFYWGLDILSVEEIRIGGLALDYCVKATAIDSRSIFGNTTVYLNATRPVAFLTGAMAIVDMAKSGVRIKGE
jgi:nicotinamidase/pyrazinamidase